MEINQQLESHFLNLYSVALSDTKVDTTELEFLYEFGKKRGVSSDKIDDVLNNPHKIRFKVPHSILEKINHLYDFAHMIWVDNSIDTREIEIYKKLCKRYGFKEENVEDLIDFLIEEAKKETPKENIFDIVKHNIDQK